MSTGHAHAPAGGPTDGATDWFRYLDILVWVSAALILALGAEWLVGYIIRERITAGAEKHISRVRAARTAEAGEPS